MPFYKENTGIMDATRLKETIHQIIDEIQDEQLLEFVYTFLKGREAGDQGKGLWESLTAAQKKEILLAYEESEDDDQLIERKRL